MDEDWESDWRDIRTKRTGGRKRVRDLTGQRFDRLVVKERCGSDKYGSALWFCECDCGNKKNVARSDLVKGRVKSCGCLMVEYRHQSKTPPRKKMATVQSTVKEATLRASYLRVLGEEPVSGTVFDDLTWTED